MDGKYGRLELVTSEVLIYEIQNHPIEMTRNAILAFVEDNSSFHVGAEHNKEVTIQNHRLFRP